MRLRDMKHRTLLMSLATMFWATTASVAKGYFARAKMYFGAPVQVGYLDYFKSFFVEEVKPPPPFFSWEYINNYLLDDVKALWARNADIFDSMIIWYLMGMLVCYGAYQLLRRRNLDLPCWFRGFTSSFARNKETAKESPPPSTGSPFPSGLPACSDGDNSIQLNERMDFIEGLLNKCLQEKQQMRDEQSALFEKLMEQSKELEKLNCLGRLETMGGAMREQECENESESESESSSDEPEDEPEATTINKHQHQPQQPFLIETEDSIILL